MYKEMLAFAIAHLGVDYIWGGASPEGLDCSGLEELATNTFAPGRFPGRQTAAEWFNILPKLVSAVPGCTTYLRNAVGKIFHVVVVERVDGDLVHVIGANGGGSWCTTHEIAKSRNACVKRAVYRANQLAGFRGWPTDEHPHHPKADRDIEPPPHTNEGEPPEGWV